MPFSTILNLFLFIVSIFVTFFTSLKSTLLYLTTNIVQSTTDENAISSATSDFGVPSIIMKSYCDFNCSINCTNVSV